MTIDLLIRGCPLPRTEAEVLVAHCLDKERTWLLAHGREQLTTEEERNIQHFLARRSSREPIAYITGRQEFYGRTFVVTPAVLIPRPATEGLVEAALDFLRAPAQGEREVDNQIVVVTRTLRAMERMHTIVDVGTGSGCIAVTIALERPALRVMATDVNEEALAVARENARRHGMEKRITFCAGTYLQPVQDLREPFLLVSNPPYIPAGTALPHDVVDFEPKEALFAGADGGDVLRELWRQAKAHPFCAGVVVECQSDQSAILT